MKRMRVWVGVLMVLLFGYLPAQEVASLPSVAQTQLAQDVRNLGLLTVVIETEGRVEPTCTQVAPPPGCMGNGIKDNAYIKGRLWLIDGDDVLYDSEEYRKNVSGMRVKIRGNSSAYIADKSQKIKLEKKADLLMGEGGGSHREWALLNYLSTSDFKTVVGFWIGKRLGKKWEPSYRWVNLLQNGKYKGIYLLAELITADEGRCNIKDDGYLFEADPYWWNEGGFVLRTDGLPYSMAYTFKYPDDLVDKSQVQGLDISLRGFESALNKGGDLNRWVDLESFARWVLVHDLMGTRDGLGSNIFMTAHKGSDGLYRLEMGPLWDFDSAFSTKGVWCSVHNASEFYYSRLFYNKDFINAYVKVWDEECNTLLEDIQDAMNDYVEEYGEAIDKSRKFMAGILPQYEQRTLSKNMEEVEEWFGSRVLWMEDEVNNLLSSSPVALPMQNEVQKVCVYSLQGKCVMQAVGVDARNWLNSMRRISFVPGVYLVEVLKNNGQVVCFKKVFN